MIEEEKLREFLIDRYETYKSMMMIARTVKDESVENSAYTGMILLEDVCYHLLSPKETALLVKGNDSPETMARIESTEKGRRQLAAEVTALMDSLDKRRAMK